MALITCSECGTQVSEFALQCPKCGNPIANAKNQKIVEKNEHPPIFDFKTNKEPSEKKKGLNYALPGIPIGSIILILIATLPFHYVPSRSKVFAKDHLTFEYTFITEEDIDHLIRKYNDASFIEKLSLENVPLYKSLIDNGILERRSNSSSEHESYNYNREDEQKRIADSIRVVDSIAMVQAEIQKERDSINQSTNSDRTTQNSNEFIKKKVGEVIEEYYSYCYYYRDPTNNTYSYILNMFTNPVERYFGAVNIKQEDISKDLEKYTQRFQLQSWNVDHNSIKISSNSSRDYFDLNYELTVVVKNLKTGILTKFHESIEMKLNSSYKIYFITEKINSKEVIVK